MRATFIETKQQWEDFRRHDDSVPERYPVVAWPQQECFGLMGDGPVSYFRYIPDLIIAGKTVAIWIQGFEAGLNARKCENQWP